MICSPIAAVLSSSNYDQLGHHAIGTGVLVEQAYGQRFDDVEIHTDSAEVPAGQQAFTRGRHIYFEPGALQPLSGNAVARWKAGVAQLSSDFEASLADVKKKIEDRHSGLLGGLTELGDDVFGLPEWVTLEYDAAEKKFGDGATSLITDISRNVNQVIDDCKKLIDQARKDIEAIVHSLPASLQTWAKGEADKLGKQLDQLSQRVDQTQHGLNQDLINRANGAVQTVRERVADLREQAKGLIGKIADAIAEFIKDPAKAIINGLLHILGIPPASFWALVDKLGDVISGIAAAPKKFANALMSGVGQGFQQFFHNLPMHLGQSLFQWLFSKMSDAGIQMPLDFSMPSILTLVLQVMGITWPRIKTILAKHIGAQNAEVLDQAYQLISTLIARGPLGVYHLVQQHLDPGMIIDAIKNAAISYVMEAIITRVTARIIMMLNPAGAILQAIEAIYRVIKWVIDNAARIFTLIEAVVNGAAQILAGNVSGVANLVERALGLLLVPVIDFLADYLGLSGIPEAIKKVIMGLQSKVEQILDKVIGFIVEKAKALWQALKSRGKKDGDGKDGDHKDGDHKDGKGDHEIVGARVTFQAHGETHTQYIDVSGGTPVAMVASTPSAVKAKIEEWRPRLRELSDDDQKRAGKLIGKAIVIEKNVAGLAEQVRAGSASNSALEEKQRELADTLAGLFELMAPDPKSSAASIVATGVMKGESHKLTVDPSKGEIRLASVEDEALTKVNAAIEKVKAMEAPAERKDDAEKALKKILAQLQSLKGMVARRSDSDRSEPDPQGVDLMKSKADAIMASLQAYGEEFGVHDVVDLPVFNSDADHQDQVGKSGVKEPSKVNVGDTIETKVGRVWAISQVTAVDAEFISYEGHLHSGPVQSKCRIDRYGVSWQEYKPGRVYKVDAAFDAIKDLSVWATYADASQVLSYRATGSYRVPPGKNWHHIHEQAGAGEHSVRNLALVDARINQVAFNQWFNRVQPGTGGQKLRQYLRGQPVEIHLEWGKKCITAHGLTLKMRDQGRGPYQEIV